MRVSFSDRLTAAPDVLFRLLSDEAVLVNLRTEQYLGLNPVGARMWNVLMAAASIEAAYEELLKEYEVEPAELRRDLGDLVDQLVDHQLVEAAPPA